MKPRLSKSSAEYLLSSRGSLHLSPSSFPPSGLKTSTRYPASTNSQYGCTSSAHQKPIDHPVCFEWLGFEATIATRLGFSGFVTSMAALIGFSPREISL